MEAIGCVWGRGEGYGGQGCPYIRTACRNLVEIKIDFIYNEKGMFVFQTS
jgi:hypothetical protein